MTPTPLITGVALTNSLVTYYTVADTNNSSKRVRLTSIRLVNTDSSARTVEVHVIPSGGSSGVATTKLKVSVAATGDVDSCQFYLLDTVMLPGTVIQAKASTGSVVMFEAMGEQ